MQAVASFLQRLRAFFFAELLPVAPGGSRETSPAAARPPSAASDARRLSVCSVLADIAFPPTIKNEKPLAWVKAL